MQLQAVSHKLHYMETFRFPDFDEDSLSLHQVLSCVFTALNLEKYLISYKIYWIFVPYSLSYNEGKVLNVRRYYILYLSLSVLV